MGPGCLGMTILTKPSGRACKLPNLHTQTRQIVAFTYQQFLPMNLHKESELGADLLFQHSPTCHQHHRGSDFVQVHFRAVVEHHEAGFARVEQLYRRLKRHRGMTRVLIHISQSLKSILMYKL